AEVWETGSLCHRVPRTSIEPGRVNPEEHLIGRDPRAKDLFDLDLPLAAVPEPDDLPHRLGVRRALGLRDRGSLGCSHEDAFRAGGTTAPYLVHRLPYL